MQCSNYPVFYCIALLDMIENKNLRDYTAIHRGRSLRHFDVTVALLFKTTDNDGYSGDRYSGNDGYSGLNPPDDAILFTVSGITAIADKKFGDFDKMTIFPHEQESED